MCIFSQTDRRKMVYDYCTTSFRGFIIGKVTVRLEHSEKDISVNVLHLLPYGILWVIIKFLLSQYKVYELDNAVILFLLDGLYWLSFCSTESNAKYGE